MGKEVNNDLNICLVGNSARLLGEGLGPQIDAHRYVCRFNDYEITQAQRADLGERTTHHWCCQDKVQPERPGVVREIVCAPHRFLPISTLSENFVLGVSAMLPEGRHASTGLVALWYYMSHGFDVTLANFDFFKSTHYFGRWTDYDQNGLDHYHAPDAERKIVEDLIQKGEIKWL